MSIISSIYPGDNFIHSNSLLSPFSPILPTPHPPSIKQAIMAPNPWNDATKSRLFLAIIHLTAPRLPNWAEVAALMGEGFTAESTR